MKKILTTTLLTAVLATSITAEVTEEYKEIMIRNSQQSLPAMLTEDLRLEKIYFSKHEKSLNYKTVFVSLDSQQLKFAKLDMVIKPSLAKGMCGDNDVSLLLEDGYKVNFDYYDKYGDYFSKTVISKEDCGKGLQFK